MFVKSKEAELGVIAKKTGDLTDAFINRDLEELASALETDELDDTIEGEESGVNPIPMIRFADDWRYFPTAMVHTSTKNKSFVELAGLYRKMGVKNYYFMLALMQPELEHVDPHDPNLDLDTKVKIAMECKYNPWYYFREVVRIPPSAGNIPDKFRANRGNIALIWLFFSNVDVGLIQPRQTGKSVSTDCLMIYLLFIGLNNTTISLITKDDKLRTANIERLKKIRDLLPKYLVYPDKLDANNQQELTYKKLGNKYITSVAQNSETAANNVARGNTVPITQCDEGPFTTYIDVTLPAALAAGTAARNESKRTGQPYGNIFTTTAGKKDDRSGRFMYEMFQRAAPWSEAFMDIPSKARLHLVVKNSCRKLSESDNAPKRTMVNCTFSHRQLGFSDAWLKDAISNAGGTPEQINRDFFNVWSSGSQGSPLSIQLLEIIQKSEQSPKHTEITKDCYAFRWYIPESLVYNTMHQGHFVIGMDTSDAIGRDEIAMLVMDVRDMSTVGAGSFNETNLITFADFLADFMTRYRNTTLVIERKSSAPAILGKLLLMLPQRGIDPFKRIYNKIVDEQHDRREDFKAIMVDLCRRSTYFHDRYIREFGFVTTGNSREHLYSRILQNAAKKAGHLVRDKQLSEQIRSLVVKKGRIDHETSGHDDMVMSWLLAAWFIMEGKHLDFYGIDTLSVMALVGDASKPMTEEDVRKKREQTKLREELEMMAGQIKSITDDFTLMRYENRIKVLTSQINTEEELVMNTLTNLVESIKQKRQLRSRMGGINRMGGGRGGYNPWNSRAA